MSASVQPSLSPFACDVLHGLTAKPKKLSPRYFYDELGSTLFEAITLLPEYGLTRADERLLRRNARSIASVVGDVGTVAELGCGSGKKTRHVLEALIGSGSNLAYRPIDISVSALGSCVKELEDVCQVNPICGDWMAGLASATVERASSKPLLLLFLGSSIGNIDRESAADFFCGIREQLRPGDYFLLGADLVKPVQTMLAAYDDALGITAAFNRNLLVRMNAELDADFRITNFRHESRWNAEARSIEMHLVSLQPQTVWIDALQTEIMFERGESIWTESSHKFTVTELDSHARSSGFQALAAWVDQEWPFAEVLWRAE
jgi:L-histidine N-alpha-methyltransferase